MQLLKPVFVVPAVLGILAGVVTSLVIDFFRTQGLGASPSIAANPTPTEREVRTIRVEGSGHDNARLSALEQRVAALASAQDQAEGAEADAEPAEERPVLDPEQRRQRLASEIAEADQRFSNDPVDPEWTRGATNQLSSAISRVGEQLGYRTLNAECRTQYCRATLRWSNSAEAVERSHFLAEMVIPGLSCAQTSLVPDPVEGDPELTTRLFLDCAELRAGNTDAL